MTGAAIVILALGLQLDPAVAAALEVLRQREVTTPPIAIVAAPPSGQSVAAYRLRRPDGRYDGTVYLVATVDERLRVIAEAIALERVRGS